MSLVTANVHDVTGAGWRDRAMVNLRGCCPVCGDSVLLVVPHGLDLHHAADGTQCPGSWPAYVAGAPQPKRPAVVHPPKRPKR